MNGALAGMVLLIIGDSHVTFMLPSLHEALIQQGAQVNSYGMCGAMADDWTNRTTSSCKAERHGAAPATISAKLEPTYSAAELLDQIHPNLAVVVLGDNMAGYGTTPTLPRAMITEQVNRLTGMITARHVPCVWVGPIWGQANSVYQKTDARVAEMAQFLSQTVAPCTFIDSTKFAKPGELPTKDGEHLTPAAYKFWGQAIADAIVRLKGQNILH